MALVSQTTLIQEAIAGKGVSFPTDTVPALAAIPSRATLLYELKQRPETKPLILMGADWQSLKPYLRGKVEELSLWQKIASAYFPGAITFVLPASDLVPKAMNPTNSGTIGIRIPASTVAREILQQTGVLATTSANLSGEATLETTAEIVRRFPMVSVLEDADPDEAKGSGMPSTVVQWDRDSWQLLRQGSVEFPL